MFRRFATAFVVVVKPTRQDRCASLTVEALAEARLRSCAVSLDEPTRTELEAAVFRRLVQHLRDRTDVQNIDLMNLAGFCRNCLANWLKDAADARGVALDKDESREAVYGMSYEEWKARHQKEASPEQLAEMRRNQSNH
jgi:hypothetical protein